MTDATAFAALQAEVVALRGDVAAMATGLNQLAEAVQIMGATLNGMSQAVQAPSGPSPIESLLRQILHHLQEQGAVLNVVAQAVTPRGSGAGQP